jgi:hypothetical protein
MSITSSSKDGIKPRPIEPRDIPAWVFHHGVAMRTRELFSPFADARPVVDHARLRHLLGTRRQRTPRAVVYLEKIAKKLRRWEVLNDKAYAYIVAACEGQQSPMEVVYHDADAVKALLSGMAGTGQPPIAVNLLATLVTRFSQGRNIGIV